MYLAHNGPRGSRFGPNDRYPAPSWRPTRGWRVDPSLAFAHALQELQFRTDAVSPAGARGLMQVRPGTAGDMARARGEAFSAASLERAAGQYRIRPDLSRAIARHGEHRRAAAQGDRLLQCRAGADRRVEQPLRPERPAALHRIAPLLGNPRLRPDHPAQLLGLRGARRRPLGQPARRSRKACGRASRPARPDRGAHRAAAAPADRDGRG